MQPADLSRISQEVQWPGQRHKSLSQLSVFPVQMKLAHKHAALARSQVASASKVAQSRKQRWRGKSEQDETRDQRAAYAFQIDRKRSYERKQSPAFIPFQPPCPQASRPAGERQLRLNPPHRYPQPSLQRLEPGSGKCKQPLQSQS